VRTAASAEVLMPSLPVSGGLINITWELLLTNAATGLFVSRERWDQRQLLLEILVSSNFRSDVEDLLSSSCHKRSFAHARCRTLRMLPDGKRPQRPYDRRGAFFALLSGIWWY
jgi:hypothetical protein